MAITKVTKAFTLDPEVFDALEVYAEIADRKNSDYLNNLLKKVFEEEKLELGFQSDNNEQSKREGGA
jgi:hypothetical protein